MVGVDEISTSCELSLLEMFVCATSLILERPGFHVLAAKCVVCVCLCVLGEETGEGGGVEIGRKRGSK